MKPIRLNPADAKQYTQKMNTVPTEFQFMDNAGDRSVKASDGGLSEFNMNTVTANGNGQNDQ